MEEKIIDKEFLEKNSFKQAKQGAGSFPWYYEDDNKYVSICLFADSGDFPLIYVENKDTEKSILFSNKHRHPYQLTIDDLKKCVEFIGVVDKFNYK